MKVIHYGFVLSYIFMGIGAQIQVAVTFLKYRNEAAKLSKKNPFRPRDLRRSAESLIKYNVYERRKMLW